MPGFLLRMALAGTMAFIAGTTCPDRITVRMWRTVIRSGQVVLTVINVIDTQLRYIWAVIRYICSCWRFFFANVYKTRLLCARTLRNHLVNTDCRTLYHNTIEVIEHTIEERNISIID